MNVTVTHEVNPEQKDELKEELREVTEQLGAQLEKTFDSWRQTKTVFVYTVFGTAAASFVAGYLTGKLTK